MFAIVYTRALSGIQAPQVTIETHLSSGLPSLSIVGLPETTVKESKDRVRSALINSHFEFPLRRITINLAPADLPKQGSRFDLPIALSILAASGQIPIEILQQYEFAAELGLSGDLRPIQGALPFALATKHSNRKLIIAKENQPETSLVKGIEVFAASHLLEVCSHLSGKQQIEPVVEQTMIENPSDYPDMSDVIGQYQAKRCLEIAAAGGHNMLMIGPPGTGKSMLAQRLPGILPPLEEHEAIEVAAIYSIATRQIDSKAWCKRPFRNPHHTASSVALVGGGNPPRPGEISLAHFGALFLDELPEFQRNVVEALREPLETGTITIARAARSHEFPAQFQLIAAMNPCPCGYWGDSNGRCRCTPDQVSRYRSRLSGPFLDRLDLHIQVPRIASELLSDISNHTGEPSEIIRQRVVQARQLQYLRGKQLNVRLQGKQLQKICHLGEKEKITFNAAIKKLNLSPRSSHRILRVARTVADLNNKEHIDCDAIHEALNFRCLDQAGYVSL